jgi:hypothetical protein
MDTIHDLHILNNFRLQKGLNGISPIRPSVRQLENCVALGIEQMDLTDMPKFTRSESFYRSIICEITEKERTHFCKINKIKI